MAFCKLLSNGVKYKFKDSSTVIHPPKALYKGFFYAFSVMSMIFKEVSLLKDFLS